MANMCIKYIIPAVTNYIGELSATAISSKAACQSAVCRYEEKLIEKLSVLTNRLYDNNELLEELIVKANDISSFQEKAEFYRDEVIPQMARVRETADCLELVTSKKYWPLPTYGDMLYKL